MGRPRLESKKWEKIKGHIQDIEQNYNMTNNQIQNKILEIIKEHKK